MILMLSGRDSLFRRILSKETDYSRGGDGRHSATRLLVLGSDLFSCQFDFILNLFLVLDVQT